MTATGGVKRQRRQPLEGVLYFRKGHKVGLFCSNSPNFAPRPPKKVWKGPEETVEFTLASTPRKQFLCLCFSPSCAEIGPREINILTNFQTSTR